MAFKQVVERGIDGFQTRDDGVEGIVPIGGALGHDDIACGQGGAFAEGVGGGRVSGFGFGRLGVGRLCLDRFGIRRRLAVARLGV